MTSSATKQHITNARVLATMGKYYWNVALEQLDRAEEQRTNAVVYQQRASADPFQYEFWQGKARRAMSLSQSYQRKAERSVSISQRHFRLLQNSYSDALLQEFALTSPFDS